MSQYQNSTVVIAKQPGAVKSVFDALNLPEILKDKKNILIKVNLRAAAVDDYTSCAITSFEVARELTTALLALGKNIIIAEGTSSKIMTKKAIERSGFRKLENDKIKVVNLNTQLTRRVEIPASPLKFLEIYKVVFEADYIISLPVMKTHTATLASLSMKNLMGLASETSIHKIHLKGLHKSIAQLAKAISPHLSLIDATQAMEGTGPVLGTCVKLDTLIAGFNPVTTDSVATQMMGFFPQEISHLKIGESLGIGPIKPNNIIGELKIHSFKKPSHGLAADMYNYQIFNWLVSKKIIHWLVYDKFYFIIKKMLKLFRHKDESRK
ncbi:DUF362 domain-containing protein [Patescibacteria group bacterium]|nr:DUF362 domain-containing protein [Patescibacteria group bacterium]MBU4511807.1 DUF362 domain-containing protein [Patescibacteria group bacterium]MCG2692557.1 DUF362 domain-containing protein [Candidatus Parcubacteria bacterium]